MSKRKGISKKLRFEVFARDNFTCRYCGRQSDEVKLVIDHIHPVCKGGDNSMENLATSCFDCNAGKAGNILCYRAPNESERLRLAQELQEQKEQAEMAQRIAIERTARFQQLVNFWCECSGKSGVDRSTASTIFCYVQKYGEAVVYAWVQQAVSLCNSDVRAGKYISGIRRMLINQGVIEE